MALRQSNTVDNYGSNKQRSSSKKSPLKLCEHIEAASVQFMASKDGGSTSHKELTQINLRIRGDNPNLGYNRFEQRVQSQPKILVTTSAAGGRHQQRESRTGLGARSRSQSRSKSKKSIKVGDGNILCGKCVVTTQVKVKPLKARLQSAKLNYNLDSCPVHGFREEKKTEGTPSDAEPTSRANFTVRLGQGITAQNPAEKVDSDNASTKNADLESRKIRDSIEFTSMTHTARQGLLLEELDEVDEDRLSEALISELRAIASGNFALQGDPVVISTQMSEVSHVKSNRLNLLSLGAYTVKEEGEFSINAQSNIATNERYSPR